MTLTESDQFYGYGSRHGCAYALGKLWVRLKVYALERSRPKGYFRRQATSEDPSNCEMELLLPVQVHPLVSMYNF